MAVALRTETPCLGARSMWLRRESGAGLLLRMSLWVALPALLHPASGWSKDPNIILITIDTLRADHVGCYGDRDARTSNLDALSHDGVLFRTVVASVPLTLPSHCSILTGAYPPLHGVRDNLGYRLEETPPTLAAILKERGYSTAAFVAADVLDPKRGLDRGFDIYSCPLHRKMGRDNPLVFNLPELRRPAGEVVDEALSWMRTVPKDRTFFLWVHLYDPHTPYNPPRRFREALRNPYDAAIAYADDEAGRIFDDLKQRRLYDSSLIVATSDHGESFGEHGERSHGYFVYDTTLLVPLIIKLPAGSGVASHRIATQVRSVDIAPTILQFIGVKAPSSMQGSELLSMMQGTHTDVPRSGAYAETYYPSEFGWSPLRALRRGRFKYIDAPKPELYDLEADPGEMHNLYPSRGAVARVMSLQLRDLLANITPNRAAQERHLDPSDVARLAALGYVGTSTPAPVKSGDILPDPKDELGTYRVLSLSAQMAAEGNCARAIPGLAELIGRQPNLLLAYLTLGKCQLAGGKYDDANRSFDSVLHLRPDNLEAAFYKGICQYQRGELEGSLATLQPLAKSLPAEPYLHFYLGMIYEEQKKSDAALAEFESCADSDPEFEVAIYKAGYLLAKAGRYVEATERFKRVLALDPDNPSAHMNLALAYAKSGNDAAAQPEFEAACRLKPAMCPSSDKP